jgi:hypothetical protein
MLPPLTIITPATTHTTLTDMDMDMRRMIPHTICHGSAESTYVQMHGKQGNATANAE